MCIRLSPPLFSAGQYDNLDKAYRGISCLKGGSAPEEIAVYEKEIRRIGLLCIYEISKFIASTLTMFFQKKKVSANRSERAQRARGRGT